MWSSRQQVARRLQLFSVSYLACLYRYPVPFQSKSLASLRYLSRALVLPSGQTPKTEAILPIIGDAGYSQSRTCGQTIQHVQAQNKLAQVALFYNLMCFECLDSLENTLVP